MMDAETFLSRTPREQSRPWFTVIYICVSLRTSGSTTFTTGPFGTTAALILLSLVATGMIG